MNHTYDLQAQHNMSSVTDEVREHHIEFLVLGIAMLALGAAAIVFPFTATLAAELLLAWILTISGILGIVHAIRTSRCRGFWLKLTVAVVSLGTGLMLLLFPFPGILSLTLLMAAFFVAAGVIRIGLGLQLRPHDNWVWLLASGVLSIVLALLILSQWPQAAAWFIGVALGIDLVFSGVNSIMLARAARQAD